MKNASQLFAPLSMAMLCLLTLFVTYTFVSSCYVMLSGQNKIVAALNKYGNVSLRETVAILEGTGALLILAPPTAVVGSLLLIIVMITTMALNMPAFGGVPGNPTTMLMLCVLLLIVHISFRLNTLLLKRTE
jgi:hypothetical protein